MNYPLIFKAAILTEIGKPLVINNIEFRGPLAEGQVLVKMKYSGICGKQTDEIDGKAPDQFIPHLLGHEGSAEVVDVGPKVTKTKKGDLVVLHWRKGSGIQAQTPLYYRNGTRVNAGWVTTFNEYAVVSENRLTVIPKGSDPVIATLFGCAVTTGVGVVLHQAKVGSGDTVIVYGCGGIGLCAVQAANLKKPQKLIAIDVNQKALDMAKKFGATDSIHADREDALKRVLEITQGKGANKVFVCVGDINVLEEGVEMTSVPGECYIVGVPPKGAHIKVEAHAVMHERNIIGTLGGGTYPDEAIPEYLKLQDEDKLQLKELVSYVGDFENINDAIEKMRGDSPGRCLVRFKA